MKQKSMKVPGKISAAQKSEPALPGKLHQNRSHFTYFIGFFLSQIKLVIKSTVAVTSNSLVKGIHSGNHLLCLHKRTIGNFKV